jgi:hypothetical protein
MSQNQGSIAHVIPAKAGIQLSSQLIISALNIDIQVFSSLLSVKIRVNPWLNISGLTSVDQYLPYVLATSIMVKMFSSCLNTDNSKALPLRCQSAITKFVSGV